MKLLEEITNGSVFEINYTGTSILYRPGTLLGGRVSFDCGTGRPISYFLEPLILLAPLCKLPLQLTLEGITNQHGYTGVDTLRTVLLPLMRHIGVQDGVELRITKRGAFPKGGGQILFHCPNVRQLQPFRRLDEGRIKRIRGIAYTTRVSPQTANRLVESARELLNHFIPDVYIYTDVYKGHESGQSPGYALSVVAETTTGCLISAEWTAEAGTTPEIVGLKASQLLYHEIQLGGCIDTISQWLVLSWMALGPEDVSKVRLGKLSPFAIQCLRDLKEFFGVTFKVEAEEKSKTVVATCLGSGFINLNKKAS